MLWIGVCAETEARADANATVTSRVMSANNRSINFFISIPSAHSGFCQILEEHCVALFFMLLLECSIASGVPEAN